MKLKILKSTSADKRQVRAGDIEEISDADARILISLGKAIAADAILMDGEVRDPEPEEAPSKIGLTEDELNTKVAEAAVETKLKRSRKR